MLNSDFDYFYEEDKMGMIVTSGTVKLRKDPNNLIGISIGGGGSLYCPCIYVVQIFDNTPAAQNGTLQCGDELISINGKSVKNKTKSEVAKMIQSTSEQVVINYNKLHADPKQGKTLDIVLKKIKHRLVEKMNASTADALGLSRAILCNDALVKRLQELEAMELTYHGLVEHCKRMFQCHLEVAHIVKAMGDVFSDMATKEPQYRASEAFRQFAEQQRSIERQTIDMVKKVKPVVNDLGTYLYKAIPDTRLTVKKYADAKFEYLAYCLKVKEMDDEEANFVALQEPLYRVETGNYEYRLILRCRQLARVKFAKLRADVLVKMELLENKHVQSLGGHLVKLLKGMSELYSSGMKLYQGTPLFPIEVDLSRDAFEYKQTSPLANTLQYQDEVEDESTSLTDVAEEAKAVHPTLISDVQNDDSSTTLISDSFEDTSLLPNVDNLTLLSTLNLSTSNSETVSNTVINSSTDVEQLLDL